MKNLFFLTFSFALLLSCASTKETETTIDPSETSETTEQSSSDQDGEQAEDSLFAHILTSYCFGNCPVYKMSIYNSGLVVLNGKANLDLLGEHTTRISKDQMDAFIAMAKDIGYFEMEDDYDNEYVMDLPSATTSIVIDGKRKQVRRRHGYPRSIIHFEALFSDLLDSESWSPGNDK
jgi:hypothetical protein